jgi:hypothetical protein
VGVEEGGEWPQFADLSLTAQHGHFPFMQAGLWIRIKGQEKGREKMKRTKICIGFQCLTLKKININC